MATLRMGVKLIPLPADRVLKSIARTAHRIFDVVLVQRDLDVPLIREQCKALADIRTRLIRLRALSFQQMRARSENNGNVDQHINPRPRIWRIVVRYVQYAVSSFERTSREFTAPCCLLASGE